MFLLPRQMRITLTARAIMHDLMAENIAVNAKVILTTLALVPARLARAFSSFGMRDFARTAVRVFARGRERCQAAETLRRVLLASALPGDFYPVAEWEEVVV